MTPRDYAASPKAAGVEAPETGAGLAQMAIDREPN
jgi:hypothetical protein